MNQTIAKWIVLVFLSIVCTYNLIYIVVYFNSRKVSRKWLVVRGFFSLLLLAGLGAFIYVFYLSQ